MGLMFPALSNAQSDNYNVDIYPDVWYNAVDGVRVGGFVLGEMEGEFKSGPHRLDAGVWLGTNFPDLPVSYYVSFTEPIPAITSYGNEGSVQLESSIRTGLSRHGLVFSKRWQQQFSDVDFQELSVSYYQEKMFDMDYRPYPQLWQIDWKSLLGINFWVSRDFNVGRFSLQASASQNVAANNFTQLDLELTQQIKLPYGFGIDLRGFTGYISNRSTPEYLYGRSYRPAVEWLDKGISRARGTVPQSLLDDGLIHLNGGANLRGYANQDFEELSSNGNPESYTAVGSVNSEIAFPNPIDHLLKRSLLGNFIHLDTYFFGDAGVFHLDDFNQTPDVIIDGPKLNADAGIGIQFSVNIPDYLGKDRGFALRYEVPFWLSDPQAGEDNFKFRNLIGIGAVISL